MNLLERLMQPSESIINQVDWRSMQIGIGLQILYQVELMDIYPLRNIWRANIIFNGNGI